MDTDWGGGGGQVLWVGWLERGHWGKNETYIILFFFKEVNKKKEVKKKNTIWRVF